MNHPESLKEDEVTRPMTLEQLTDLRKLAQLRKEKGATERRGQGSAKTAS